ncbi:MAG: aldo/keto reductase [Chloroflexota bacterium]|nr:aldo/keto reductase [Chloroflexota bacterium]
MNYRRHKDLLISEIGLGCYGLSGAYGPTDIESYKAALRRGYELGVNFFDTAEAYGDAEHVLGEVIKPFRQHVYVSTKVGVREGFNPDLSADYVRKACERSLQALKMETIDLYQVHFDDPQTPVAETVAALEGLVQQGKIRYYGLGHLPALRVWEYVQKGNVFSVMMELSAAARDARDEILPFCQEHNLAAIAFSVTGRGLLTGAIEMNDAFEADDIRSIDPLFQKTNFQSGLRVADKLTEIGARHGKTGAQTAIAWVLAQPGVTCALTGPSSIAHLEENIGGSDWTFTELDIIKFENYLKVEELRLKIEGRFEVSRILTEPLPADPNQALIDLVYACENAVRLKMIDEQVLMPVFITLMELRDDMDEEALDKMRHIQAELKEYA